MKRLSLFLSCLIFLFAGAIVVSAQTPLESVPVDSNVPDVRLYNVSLDKDTYDPGGTLKSTFIVENLTDELIPLLYYRVHLIENNDSNLENLQIYDSKLFGPIYLTEGESKFMEFSYVIPEEVPSSNLGIMIVAYLQDDTELGFDEAYFKLSTTRSNPLSISSASILVDDRPFMLEEGPSVDAGASPILRTDLISNKDITVTPHIEVYKKSDIANVLITKDYTRFPLKSQISESHDIDLPSFDKGGVYIGSLSFRDENRKQVGEKLSFRYIVRGSQGSLVNLSTDVSSVEDRGQISLRIDYTGAPFDIVRFEKASQGGGTLKVRLYNEYDELVGEISKEISLDLTDGVSVSNVVAQKSARALRGEAEIFKNGEVVDSLHVFLSPDYENEKALASSRPKSVLDTQTVLLGLGGLVALLILVIIIIGLWKKKQMTALIIIISGALISGGVIGISNLEAQGDNEPFKTEIGGDLNKFHAPHLSVNLPSTVASGAQFSVRGSVGAAVCNNLSAHWHLQVHVREKDTNQKIKGKWRSFGTPRGFTSDGDDEHDMEFFENRFRANFNATYKAEGGNSPVNLPPGTYKVVVRAYQSFYNRNGGYEGSTWKVRKYDLVVAGSERDLCPRINGELDPEIQTRIPTGLNDDDGDGNCTSGGCVGDECDRDKCTAEERRPGGKCNPNDCTEDKWTPLEWGACDLDTNIQTRRYRLDYDCPNADSTEPRDTRPCAPPDPRCELHNDAGECLPPAIIGFTSRPDPTQTPDPDKLEESRGCDLSWSARNANRCEIKRCDLQGGACDDNLMSVNASVSTTTQNVKPANPSLYTLTCYNGEISSAPKSATCRFQTVEEN